MDNIGPSGERHPGTAPTFTPIREQDVVAQRIEAERYRINLANTLRALSEAGAATVAVQFTGWGSTLAIEDTSFEPVGIDGGAYRVVCVTAHEEQRTGEGFRRYRKRDLTLTEAAEEVAIQYGELTRVRLKDDAAVRTSIRISAEDGSLGMTLHRTS